VVIPREIRSALSAHAAAELPNEACGLIAFRDGIAERYLPGTNEVHSPYRFELRPGEPEDYFLEDEGYELAVFHSHPSSEPRPSRTDVENIGLWAGRPYVVYSVARDELAAWRIVEQRIEAIPLADDESATASGTSSSI
jgi:proteasome lid subunit RPN8/RPN11